MISLKKTSLYIIVLSSIALSVSNDIWVSGYYTGWNQPNYPPQNVDFDAITHIIHFSVLPNGDGSLDYSMHGISPEHSQALISQAHAASVPVIICVGGYGVIDRFRSASSDANRANFVSSLVSFMRERGYDGIDMDWEPLEASDHANYEKLIIELSDALSAISPRPLLTAATIKSGSLMKRLADRFDQINIMTYDISRPYQGWLVWHNAPVYNGGNTFASIGTPLPCCDTWVDEFTDSGVPIEKLGIGLPFYGFIWTGGSGTETGGVTAPLQQYTTDPACDGNLPYSTIMNNWFSADRFKWDEDAQVPYLSIDNTGSDQDVFISYDDEESSKCKVRYARKKGIGGLIIFELQQGFHNGTNPLLTAIKEAKAEPVGNKHQIKADVTKEHIGISLQNQQIRFISSMDLSESKVSIYSPEGKLVLFSSLEKDYESGCVWTTGSKNKMPVSGCYIVRISNKNNDKSVSFSVGFVR